MVIKSAGMECNKMVGQRKWPEPEGAEVIIDLEFKVQALSPRVYHAEATFAFPTGKRDFSYFSVSKSSKTERGALRCVIEEIENSKWFHYFRFKGVRFRVRGCGMDKVYRGYL
jgi:hypothetical protein